MESLSTKLFAPTPYLEDLDVSDCDLTSLWHDSSKQPRVGEMLKNLKVLNASNNDIKNIFANDLSVRLMNCRQVMQTFQCCFNTFADHEES